MGLDTTHDAWSGPYSSFNTWRKWIAKQIGIELDKMEGFGGEKEWNPDLPLYPLLDHSDCDGEIFWKDCKVIAIELQKILDNLDRTKKDEYHQELQWLVVATKRFIRGCNEAFDLKEDIEFH